MTRANKKSRYFNIRLSSRERAAVQRAAKKSGQPASAWARQVLAERAAQAAPDDEEGGKPAASAA